jgi:hypothetical protein
MTSSRITKESEIRILTEQPLKNTFKHLSAFNPLGIPEELFPVNSR